MNHKGEGLRKQMRLPLIVAPMFLVSGPELVLASCGAGGMGSFPFPNARTIDVLEDWLEQISQGRAALSEDGASGPVGPWAANMVVHSSYDRLQDELALIKKYEPPVVITALGSPKAVIDTVHGYGGLVFADVNNIEFARKAASAGVDGLVLVAAGAGGHTGAIAGFAFVPAVREFFDGIIVLGGGICDGRAVRAAEILGADFAYMGTSFIAVEESMAKPEYREMVLESSYNDLIISNFFTGVPASYMRQSIERAGLDPDNLVREAGMDLSQSQTGVKAWRDVWSAGQGVGSVKEMQSTAALVSQIEEDYNKACGLPHF